jgi:hypothetical protein
MSMTFDEWCNSKSIRGNWREALYHQMMATREGPARDDPAEWEKAWNEILDREMRETRA